MSDTPYIKGEDELLLLHLVASGDKSAFEQLYKLHEGGLEKYVFFITRSREVTEEIIQDIFISVWRKREKLPELYSFRGYLYQIARNRVISYLRGIKTQYRLVQLDEDIPGSSPNQADHDILYKQYYKIVLDAIETLPERKKEVFALSLDEDLTLQEIAQRLGIAKSTVKQHLYSASASIRDYLKKHSDITAVMLVSVTMMAHSQNNFPMN
jgi:RNA polymerase sigma-70 factor (ECF subfamily)